MSETAWIAVIALVVGTMQGIGLFMLSGIRADIADIWKRINNHGHDIKCKSKECDAETVAVLIKER